jgi:hypothetical protein
LDVLYQSFSGQGVESVQRLRGLLHALVHTNLAFFSYEDMFRPIRQIFPLANRSTDWQSGRPVGVQVNLLANRNIWCMGQPIGKVVNQCNKFTMLIPSTKLLIYTLREPLNLFFLLPLRMSFPCHSCCTLSSNCCIGSLSCTQSS